MNAHLSNPETLLHPRHLIPIYQLARVALDRSGWCQGRSVTPTGERCIVSALGAAARELGPNPATAARLAMMAADLTQGVLHDQIREACAGTILRPTRPALTAWNDAPERTIGDVLALLRLSEAYAVEWAATVDREGGAR